MRGNQLMKTIRKTPRQTRKPVSDQVRQVPRPWLRRLCLVGLGVLGFLITYEVVALTRKPAAVEEVDPPTTSKEKADPTVSCCTDSDSIAEPEGSTDKAVDKDSQVAKINDRAAPGKAPEGMVWI